TATLLRSGTDRAPLRRADAPSPQHQGTDQSLGTCAPNPGTATLLRSGTARAPLRRADVPSPQHHGTDQSLGTSSPFLALQRCSGRGPPALRSGARTLQVRSTRARTSRLEPPRHSWHCNVAAVGDRPRSAPARGRSESAAPGHGPVAWNLLAIPGTATL